MASGADNDIELLKACLATPTFPGDPTNEPIWRQPASENDHLIGSPQDGRWIEAKA